MKGSLRLFIKALRENGRRIIGPLLLVIGAEVVSVGLLYGLNTVYGKLYQAIQEYHHNAIYLNIAHFSIIAMVLVFVNGMMGLFANLLSLEIRTGLTRGALGVLPKHRDMPLVGQRIQEDLKKYAETSVQLFTSVFKALLTLPIFLGVIISLTKPWIGLAIVAIVFAGTVWTKVASRKLIQMQAVQESNEAEFRAQLTEKSYDHVVTQTHPIINELKKLSFIQNGLGQAFALVPFIILMPLYVAKTITMGAFFQAVNALGKIIDSLSILIDNRQLISQVESSLVRLEWYYKKEASNDSQRIN